MSWLREYAVPIAVTAVLHAALVFWLASDFLSTPPAHKVKTPKFMTAKVVQLKETQKAVKKPKAKPKKPPKKKTPPKKKPKKDNSKQKALEKKRKAALAEKKRKAAEKARLEKEKKDREAKEKAEKERLAKELALQQERERDRREQELLDSLAEEEELNNAAADEATAMNYMSAIQQAIQTNWSRPPSARNGMEVLLDIQLVPTGAVINVTVAKSSGNDAFDRSAIAAVDKAERFPELAELEPRVFERYYRRFQLLFKPEDLRL